MKRRTNILVAGGVLACAVFGVAAAGPIEDGQAAAQRGDYATEIRLIRPLAEQGNAIAQGRLGSMYLTGQGVPQDYAQAISWFRKAADKGHSLAQAGLGALYARGIGVPQDYVQAHMWFNLAATARVAEVRETASKARDEVAAKMTPEQIAEAQRLARDWKPRTPSP
jgi:TPR repeat protein